VRFAFLDPLFAVVAFVARHKQILPVRWGNVNTRGAEKRQRRTAAFLKIVAEESAAEIAAEIPVEVAVIVAVKIAVEVAVVVEDEAMRFHDDARGNLHGRSPEPGDPDSVRSVIAIDPDISGARTGRTYNRDRRGSAESDPY
jgi:hypothetical protein